MRQLNVPDDFQNAVHQMLEESDQGRIDYLLIETSGVTDPVTAIRHLDAKYGKLYRARLDTVVTVVVRQSFWKILIGSSRSTRRCTGPTDCLGIWPSRISGSRRTRIT